MNRRISGPGNMRYRNFSSLGKAGLHLVALRFNPAKSNPEKFESCSPHRRSVMSCLFRPIWIVSLLSLALIPGCQHNISLPFVSPTAISQSVTTNAEMALQIRLTAVLGTVGDNLTYAVVSNPTHGILSGQAPNLTYSPNTDYAGSDSFTFTATENGLESNIAAVSITVVQPAPTANNQNVPTNENTALPITLTGTPGTPGDTLTYTITESPTQGILSGTAPNLTYTPATGYTGNDSFMFTATDNGVVSSEAATFSINVAPVPVVLYTDLLSGPNSGGENNNGTYLSILGKNFGASGLGTTTRVFIGGAEVASYRYLGFSNGRPDVQQITVQVGALGNPTPGTPLPINVQVNGVNSTSYTPQIFIVNPGRILFVSLTGNKAGGVAGDITHPWRYIQSPSYTRLSPDVASVWGAAQPGDVIVMRGGLWSDYSANSSGHIHFAQFAGGPLGSAPTGASGTGPITIISYPTEAVTIDLSQNSKYTAATGFYGVLSGTDSSASGYVDGSGNPLYSQWITIADLIIPKGGTEDGPINLQINSSHWRVVNNDLAAPDSITANAGGVCGDGTYDVVLGNHIHDIAGKSNLQNHGIYLDEGSNYELAYNVIERITGGNGIQTYNSNDSTIFSNVNIHHNWIHDVNKHGINIADYSGPGFTVWDNVVYNTVAACLRMNSDYVSGAEIWNNLFYNCYTSGKDGAVTNDDSTSTISADFRNNIVWPSKNSSNSQIYVGGDQGFTGTGITFNNNLWFNGTDPGDVTSLDANAIFADPMLANVNNTPYTLPNFHLLSGSPAINSGDTTVRPLVISNYDLNPLPNSLGDYDIGPY